MTFTICNVVHILAIIVLLAYAFYGEYQDITRKRGFSSCETAIITKLHPTQTDSVLKLVNNIIDLTITYKSTVVWRKTLIISLLITCIYTTFVGTHCNVRIFFITFIMLFFVILQTLTYTLYHTFSPISRIIKENLHAISEKYYEN